MSPHCQVGPQFEHIPSQFDSNHLGADPLGSLPHIYHNFKTQIIGNSHEFNH